MILAARRGNCIASDAQRKLHGLDIRHGYAAEDNHQKREMIGIKVLICYLFKVRNMHPT